MIKGLDIDIEEIEINIFIKNLNSQIQRLCLEKDDVIKIVESLYNKMEE